MDFDETKIINGTEEETVSMFEKLPELTGILYQIACDAIDAYLEKTAQDDCVDLAYYKYFLDLECVQLDHDFKPFDAFAIRKTYDIDVDISENSLNLQNESQNAIKREV